MTKIAIISDIHGNKTALEAVLKDIRLRKIERIFCLGDLIGKGPRGSECIELIQKNCERVVRGNWDVFIQSPTDDVFLQWYKDRLTEKDYQYLASLPFNIDLELNGQLIRFFHASPRSEFERISVNHSIEQRLSMFENSEITNSINYTKLPDIVFYGDIHTTFLHTYKKGILCNVGSVGNSLDLTSASYAILDGTHSNNAIQFIRVDYDRQAELKIAEELGLPQLDKYYGEIMFANYRNA
ncbi:serine/threonine protein phosphatase [Lysinibacillus xylanilyticus]|uniref:Serine/threonine protein phosphatase n=1 Tax=Lysinibacillus xylanilyticus TaxID=582475 RepID=A0A0K9FEN3_9BACI|nr:metallophosphoesterase family protein [Lysinibacillus xylanilyticus]KMY32648.1 serine/threonine protein phosphatase [Lysinibacillus xylanilyticus]